MLENTKEDMHFRLALSKKHRKIWSPLQRKHKRIWSPLCTLEEVKKIKIWFPLCTPGEVKRIKVSLRRYGKGNAVVGKIGAFLRRVGKEILRVKIKVFPKRLVNGGIVSVRIKAFLRRLLVKGKILWKLKITVNLCFPKRRTNNNRLPWKLVVQGPIIKRMLSILLISRGKLIGIFN